MKKLLQGESGSRSIKVDLEAKTAQVTHCWKKDKNAARYELSFTYSLDVDEKEIHRLAVLWINKDFQNRMRSEGTTEKELIELEKSPISVLEMYSKKERAPRDPKKAAASALSKLSKEEVKAILAKFS